MDDNASFEYSDNEVENSHNNSIILLAYNLIEELTYEIKMGDYVEFKHNNEIIKGFVEEVRVDYGSSENESSTNIGRTQFCNENSWSNYVLKGITLKSIKENLIVHKKSKLCNELLLGAKKIKSFLNIVKEKDSYLSNLKEKAS